MGSIQYRYRLQCGTEMGCWARSEREHWPSRRAPAHAGWEHHRFDAGHADGCQLRHDVPFLGRDDDDGHHSLRGFDMLGSFRDWRRCGEFQDRIRATKTMASTWFDKAFQSQLGSIRVMAFVSSISVGARTFTTRWTTPNAGRWPGRTTSCRSAARTIWLDAAGSFTQLSARCGSDRQ